MLLYCGGGGRGVFEREDSCIFTINVLKCRSHLQNSPDDNEGIIIIGNPFLQDQSRNIFVIRSRPV